MTRDEALSRLLSGELPADEAAEWRERIRTDADVARAWTRLRQLTDDLGAVPMDIPSDALVQRAAQVPPVQDAQRPRRVWPWAALAAAALGMVVGASLPEPVPTLSLSHGEQHVVGHAQMLAGGLPVRIDGDVLVSVEPAQASLRGLSQEVNVNLTHVAGFGAGVLVTIAVNQGMAWVDTAETEQAVEIPAGTTRTLQGATRFAMEPATTGGGVRSTDAPPDEQIASLEAAIQQLTFERDALRGQLAAAGGEAIDWPDDLRPELGPDQFADTIKAMLADSDVEIADVDCSEYPCLAVFDLGAADDPMQAAQEMAETLRTGAETVLGDDDIGMGVQIEAVDSSDGPPTMLMGVSLGSEGADPRDTRVNARLTDMLEQWRPAGSTP